MYDYPERKFGTIRGILSDKSFITDQNGYVPPRLLELRDEWASQDPWVFFKKTFTKRKNYLKRKGILSKEHVAYCIYVEKETKQIR